MTWQDTKYGNHSQLETTVTLEDEKGGSLCVLSVTPIRMLKLFDIMPANRLISYTRQTETRGWADRPANDAIDCVIFLVTRRIRYENIYAIHTDDVVRSFPSQHVQFHQLLPINTCRNVAAASESCRCSRVVEV